MIQGVIRLVRKFTDALFSGFAKPALHGRKVIYPWGVLGRGYVIASDDVEEQLKQRYAIFVIVAVILLGVASAAAGIAGGLAAMVLCLVGYAIYMKRVVAGLQPSDEGLSLAQAYGAMARAYSIRELWSWVFCGILLFGIGTAMVFTGHPGFTKSELGSLPELVLFFGFGILAVVFGGWMLWLRRGA